MKTGFQRIHPNRCNKQSGVSLIEALVALLVLALGVLGLAGVQIRTVTEARLSNGRASAVRMVEDLHERMKLNREAALLPVNPYITAWGAGPAGPDCVAGPCNAQQFAQYDLAQWKTSLGRNLPGGDASVFRSPTDPTQFGILVGWNHTPSNSALTDTALFNAPFDINTGVNGVQCRAGQICHLVFVRP